MTAAIQFFHAIPTPALLALGWGFSALCSSMPALPEKAGYGLTWAHNFLQAIAGNINKIRS